MDIDAVISPAKGKGHRVRAMCVLSAVEHIFNETAMHAKTQASNRMAKAKRASHGPRVSLHSQAKVRVKKTRENPKEHPKEPKVRTKVPQAYTRTKTSKAGLSGLENSKSEASSDIPESAQTCTTDTSWNDGWNGDEWNDDWIGVGWHEDCEQTYNTFASSFSLGSWDLGAKISSKRFEWVSGFLTVDLGSFKDTTTTVCSDLFTGAHQVLCSAAEIARKGRPDFYQGHDGGYMIPSHSKIGQGMRIHIEK